MKNAAAVRMAAMPMPLCWFNNNATQWRLAKTTAAHRTTNRVHWRCTRPAQRRTRCPLPSSCQIVTRRTTATTTAEPGMEMMRNRPVSWFSTP